MRGSSRGEEAPWRGGSEDNGAASPANQLIVGYKRRADALREDLRVHARSLRRVDVRGDEILERRCQHARHSVVAFLAVGEARQRGSLLRAEVLDKLPARHRRELGVTEELIRVVGDLRHDQRAAAICRVVGQQNRPARLAVEAARVGIDSLVHEAADLILSFDDREIVRKKVGVEAAGELMTRPQRRAILLVVAIPEGRGAVVAAAFEAVKRLGGAHVDLHGAALARD